MLYSIEPGQNWARERRPSVPYCRVQVECVALVTPKWAELREQFFSSFLSCIVAVRNKLSGSKRLAIESPVANKLVVSLAAFVFCCYSVILGSCLELHEHERACSANYSSA